MDLFFYMRFWCLPFALFCFCISIESVKSEPDECYPWKSVFTEVLPSEGGTDWNTLMLSDNNKWKYLIYSQRLIEKHNTARWVIVNPYSDDRPEVNCVISRGKGILALRSLDSTNPTAKFGMPGSGYPRCGGKFGSKENPLGSLGVRMWASKELGKSSILSFPEFGNKAFTVILSDVGKYWILLRDNKDGSSCYHDRGKGYKIREIELKKEK